MTLNRPGKLRGRPNAPVRGPKVDKKESEQDKTDSTKPSSDESPKDPDPEDT